MLLYVILLTLKADTTTGSFYICCLFQVLSVIIKFLAISTVVHLYTIICTDGAVEYMCPCILLTIACVINNGFMHFDCDILQSYR